MSRWGSSNFLASQIAAEVGNTKAVSHGKSPSSPPSADKFVDLVISIPTSVYDRVAERLYEEKDSKGVRELSVMLLEEYGREEQRAKVK